MFVVFYKEARPYQVKRQKGGKMSAHDKVSETDSETNVDDVPQRDLVEPIALLGLIVAFFVLGYALFVKP